MSDRKSRALKRMVWGLAVMAYLGVIAWSASLAADAPRTAEDVYRTYKGKWAHVAEILTLLPPWFYFTCGVVGLLAAHAAWFLRKDPPIDDAPAGPHFRRSTPNARRLRAGFRILIWLAGLAAGTACVWMTFDDAFDRNAFLVPVSAMGLTARLAIAILLTRFWLDVAIYVVTARRLSVGLAFRLALYGAPAALLFIGRDVRVPIEAVAALAFAIPWLMARPPYVRRTGPWWALRKSRVDGKKRRLLRDVGNLIMPFGLREEKKFVEIPGPRGPVQVGRRATWSRCGWLSLVVLTLLATLGLDRLKDHYVRKADKDLTGIGGYQRIVTTRVVDRDGEPVLSYTLTNRTWIPLERIPPHVRQAFIAAEDRNFYRHHGIDPNAIVRAELHNASNDSKQGGSTITQQVVKQVILKDSSQTMERKLTEIFLSVELERLVDKDRILEVYLNHNFLGENAYGVQAAASTYFGRDVEELTLAEAAMLAGLTKAPSRDSPDDHFGNARKRQAYVLNRMVEDGYITDVERDAALAERIITNERGDDLVMTQAPHFGVRTRKWLQSRYGYDAVFKKGLKVDSTIDLDYQIAASDALMNGLRDLERKLGFEGPEGRDPDFVGDCTGPKESVHDYAIELKAPIVAEGAGFKACVRGNLFPFDDEDVRRIRDWETKTRKRLATGDQVTVRVWPREEGTTTVRKVVTARRTKGPRGLNGALVAVDPRSGHVLAAVGGYDFGESQWDMTTQSQRQPGSSIKPMVYATGFERGMTVVDSYVDEPTCVGDWCPENYMGIHTTHRYLGRIDLRTAMAKSANMVAVKIAKEYGFGEVIRLMRRAGYVTPMTNFPTLALGSEVVTPWEHVMGYAAIASGGRRMPNQPGSDLPGIFVTEVSDESGRTIERFDQAPNEQAFSSGAAYLTQYVMRGVVEDSGGTGRRARTLKRPIIAKTGTSNDFNDAWFIGCTVELCVGVWVGRELMVPISEELETTGGSVAVPIWSAFMQAVDPVTPDEPALEFPVPSDILLMGDDGGIPFQAGHVPDAYLRRMSDKDDGPLFR